MTLTPHIIIETIMEMGPRHPTWRDPEALRRIVGLMQQSVLFDFGMMRPAMEHKAFALDLYERGLFGLPYPVTAFAFDGRPHSNPHIKTPNRTGALMLVTERNGKLSAVMCSERIDQDGRPMGGIPIGVIANAEFENPRDDTADVEATYPVMSDEIMAMMYGDCGPKGHALMVQRLCSNLVGCMGMTVMLMSKGVTTEHHPAPEKPNKARERKGRPQIAERYVVRIAAGDLRTITTEAGEETIAGHVRGSPRLHWRRGHFRTLNRGSGGERVIPVAPAMIGANETAGEVRRKAYEVRR